MINLLKYLVNRSPIINEVTSGIRKQLVWPKEKKRNAGRRGLRNRGHRAETLTLHHHPSLKADPEKPQAASRKKGTEGRRVFKATVSTHDFGPTLWSVFLAVRSQQVQGLIWPYYTSDWHGSQAGQLHSGRGIYTVPCSRPANPAWIN